MLDLKKFNLFLFMTQGLSLSKWEQAGILSRELAPYNLLAKHFNKIFIFTYGDRTELKYRPRLEPNVIIAYRRLSIPTRYYKFLGPILYWRLIRQSHFFKTNQLRGAAAALVAKRLNPRAKLILRTGYTQSLFDLQAGVSPSPHKSLERHAYHACDLALVTSQADRNYLIKTYSLPPSKIQIIANYIDTDLFSPHPEISPHLDRLVFVGRAANPQKNLPLLIEALSQTKLTLDIIGPLKDSASLQKLANYWQTSLNFIGLIDNTALPAILNRYPIFILPSLYEGMPKSLLEAMACGLAVVATDVPGNREVVQNNFNGLLVPPAATALRAAILALHRDPALRQKLGQAARQFVVANFSLRSQIAKEISLYQNFLA